MADFTYCSTRSGVVYVAFITDVFARRIVGRKAARTMHANLVVDALNMAAWTRRDTSLEGLICHSDAGSQRYTSIAYTERLDELDANPSIGTVGGLRQRYGRISQRSVQDRVAPQPRRARPQWRPLARPRRPRDRHLRLGQAVEHERLHGELDDLTRAEVEATYYRDRDQAEAA